MMRLVEYLNQLCWSQADLARKAGVSSNSVQRALDGQRLSRRVAAAIVTALGAGTGKALQVKDVSDLRIVTVRRRKTGERAPTTAQQEPATMPTRRGKAQNEGQL
jgi:transcriptional regulator with XRE-family HTH domain